MNIAPPNLTPIEIERCYQQFLRQNGGIPMPKPEKPIIRETHDILPTLINRWYGKSIYDSMITRPTPKHILQTAHYLNRWLRWLNFGIVY